MTSQELYDLMKHIQKPEISTRELIEQANKSYSISDQYEDYGKHIRGLQQVLKKEHKITNVRHGYWAVIE